MKNKIIISVIIFTTLTASAQAATMSNPIFSFAYPDHWELAPYDGIYSTYSSLVFFDPNGQGTDILVNRISEADAGELGIAAMADLGIPIQTVGQTSLFGVPATKYAHQPVADFEFYGEIIISEVKDGYFYKVATISDDPNFDVESKISYSAPEQPGIGGFASRVWSGIAGFFRNLFR